VKWSEVTGATGYKVQVLDSQGNALSQSHQPTIDPSPIGTAATATISGLAAGATYKVEVQATADDSTSAWSAAKDMAILSKPDTSSVVCADDGVVTVKWSEVTGATGYKVQVLDSQGNALSTSDQPTIAPSPIGIATSATISGLAAGATYQVEVQATAEDSKSAWSLPPTIITIPKINKFSAQVVRTGTGGPSLQFSWGVENAGKLQIKGFSGKIYDVSTIIATGFYSVPITTMTNCLETQYTLIATQKNGGKQQKLLLANWNEKSTVAVGGNPSGIAITPDGTRVFVSNNGSGGGGNTVSVIENKNTGSLPKTANSTVTV
ncbi:MAG: fibronectin type III domain-containing protein, partial [Planctomycetes bacterium]|nr:fibronectin type III domain-containing protein [Planctomycetota bacterium]